MTHTRNVKLLVALILAIVLAPARSFAQSSDAPVYIITQITDEDGGQSRAYAINDFGQVIGWVNKDGNHNSAHWLGDQFSNLQRTVHFDLIQFFAVPYNEAYDISNGGQVIGTARNEILCAERTYTISTGYLLRPAVLTDLGTPVPGDAQLDFGAYGIACDQSFDSAAVGISNEGHVVGWADTDPANHPDDPNHPAGAIRAWLSTPIDGVWSNKINLGVLAPDGVVSSATAVNDSGWVTGYSYLGGNSAAGETRYHAFLVVPQGDDWNVWGAGGKNELMSDLGTLGGDNSWGRDINNSGDVVGEAGTASFASEAFHYSYADDQMTSLGTLGGSNSSAGGINDDGDIVGWAEDAEGNRSAFLYRDGEMQDLNELLIVTSRPTIRLTEARDINERGQIVGWGVSKSGGQDDTIAFLLTPATAEQIAEAEAIANGEETPSNDSDSTDSGTSNGGSTGGSSGDFDGNPLFGTPATLLQQATQDGADGASDPNSDTTSDDPVATFCGLGTASFAPLTMLGLLLMRRRS